MLTWSCRRAPSLAAASSHSPSPLPLLRLTLRLRLWGFAFRFSGTLDVALGGLPSGAMAAAPPSPMPEPRPSPSGTATVVMSQAGGDELRFTCPHMVGRATSQVVGRGGGHGHNGIEPL